MKNLVRLALLPGLLAAADGFPHPRGYVAYRARGPIAIDGRLDDDAWRDAPWSEDFVDIEGPAAKPAPRFRTRVKMTWDGRCLYIAALLEEPHVWGSLTQHDSVIFNDNDFEVFLDPDGDNHNYFELEINALNTEWDLFLAKPYRDDGKADNSWEIPGLKTAVHIDGTLNNPSDSDRGWSVEIALPWEAVRAHAGRRTPPGDGDHWRINFSRVEWKYIIASGGYQKVKGAREDNWVWSPQYAIDMHRPEHWGYVQFSTAPPGTVAFRRDPTAPARDRLRAVYYAQREYREKQGRYADSLAALGIAPGPDLRLTPGRWEASWGGLTIRQDSRIR